MQPEYALSRRDFPPGGFRFGLNSRDLRTWLISFFLLSFLPACRQPPNLVDPEPVQAFKGVRLKLGLGEGISQPHLVRQSVREWSARTGAEVEILPGIWNGTDPVDFAIFSAVDLPREIHAKRIVPLPEAYRSARSTYRWNDLSGSITDRMASWDARAYGLPLFNEGRVLVYRTDRWNEFATAKKHAASQPETWEDLCDFAEFFNRPTQASLPPLSKRSDELNHELHRIAANYDRVSTSEVNRSPGTRTPEQSEAFFSFDFSTLTGEPRINAPAFVHAAGLMKRLQACRPSEPSEDPMGAFRDGRAVAGIAPLDLLTQLSEPGTAVSGRFGIAPLPGSRTVFESGKVVPLETVNRVPYLGEAVWIGAVTPGCTNAEAAWDFFVEFAHPTTNSLDHISAGKWGAGGFRGTHFDAANRNHWFGYGLDGPRTERLIEIQRQNAGVSIANPTFALRLPNRLQYLAPLRTELDRILTGKVASQEGLDEVARRWRAEKPDPVAYRISLGL